MKRDVRHEGPPPPPTPETVEEVVDAMRRLLTKQRDGEPADPIAAADLVKRLRKARHG